MTVTNATTGLFAELPQPLCALLFANAKLVHLAANEVLFVAEDTGDGCYRIEKGLLKVSMVSGSGAERIIAIFGTGAIVGELSVLDGLPRSATVLALRDSELLFVSKAKSKIPRALPASFDAACLTFAGTNDVIAAESFLPLRVKVALTLMDLAEHFGERVGESRIMIRHKFGQSDLAAMAGIARENVSRIVMDLTRRKLGSKLINFAAAARQS